MERVLVGAWSLDSAMGNGIVDLLRNENYEVIANGLEALRFLEQPRLSEFANEISKAFAASEIGVASEDLIARVERLPRQQREDLERELAKVEAPFLNEIWLEGIIINSAIRYMEANIASLRKRKPGSAG